MKQILQNLKSGLTELAEVPCPRTARGSLLIQSRCTLISAGTERMLVEFGKANVIGKARQQPDKVRMVLDKVKTDGLHADARSGVQQARSAVCRSATAMSGRVIDVGSGVDRLFA